MEHAQELTDGSDCRHGFWQCFVLYQIDLIQTMPQGQHQLLTAHSMLQDETEHKLALYSSSATSVSFLLSNTHADRLEYMSKVISFKMHKKLYSKC